MIVIPLVVTKVSKSSRIIDATKFAMLRPTIQRLTMQGWKLCRDIRNLCCDNHKMKSMNFFVTFPKYVMTQFEERATNIVVILIPLSR